MKKPFGRLTGRIALAGIVSMTVLCGTAVFAAESVAESVAEPAADGAYKIAYVAAERDEFMSLLENAVIETAEEYGVDLTVLFSEDNSQKQFENIKEAAAGDYDALIVSTVMAEDVPDCIAAAAGKNLVFLNRIPEYGDLLTGNIAAVAADESKSGAYQGEFLAKHFLEQGIQEVNYVLLRGTEGMAHTNQRSNGALKRATEEGLMMIPATGMLQGDYDRATAKEEISKILGSVDFDCIIANNDAMAIGAIEAMEEAGIDPKEYTIVGIDATDDAVEQLREGNLAMTVFQNAYGEAEASIQAAINLIEGKEPGTDTKYEIAENNPAIIYVPFVPVTLDNVDTFKE